MKLRVRRLSCLQPFAIACASHRKLEKLISSSREVASKHDERLASLEDKLNLVLGSLEATREHGGNTQHERTLPKPQGAVEAHQAPLRTECDRGRLAAGKAAQPSRRQTLGLSSHGAGGAPRPPMPPEPSTLFDDGLKMRARHDDDDSGLWQWL